MPIVDIKNSNSWYQELQLLISVIPIVDIRNTSCWYQECAHIPGIMKSICWYQEFEFLLSAIDYWYQ